RRRSTAGPRRRRTCSASSTLPRWSGPTRSPRLAGPFVRLPEAERVPLGVAAGREPAVALHGHLVVGLAPQRLDLGAGRVDVVGVEVDAEVAGLVRGEDRAALILARAEHPVVHLRRHRWADLPAEDAAPEPLRAVGVRRSDLDVHELACHRVLLLSTSLSSFDSTRKESMYRVV